MKNRFDQQLEKLNTELVTMGALCEDAITYAINALFERDHEMVKRAEDAEKQLDRMERDIENVCMGLLLQQHPVAKDLRMISSALKMISDMERIGDQAEDIAEIVRYLADEEMPNPHHLKAMSEFAAGMVTSSINSFVKGDLDLAKKVILDDDVVDGYFAKVKEDLINAVAASKINGQFLLDILMIAKYIERVGDHATNIAEWVVYSITGAHPEETN